MDETGSFHITIGIPFMNFCRLSLYEMAWLLSWSGADVQTFLQRSSTLHGLIASSCSESEFLANVQIVSERQILPALYTFASTPSSTLLHAQQYGTNLFPYQQQALLWLRCCIDGHLLLPHLYPVVRAGENPIFLARTFQSEHFTSTILVTPMMIPHVYALMLPTGTGKTVVTLRAMAPQERWLVIVPTSLAGQWVSETIRWRYGCHATEHRKFCSKQAIDMARCKTVITTWSMLNKMPRDMFASHTWSGIVVDEAQQLKPNGTKWRSICQIIDTTMHLAPRQHRSLPLILLSATLPMQTVYSALCRMQSTSTSMSRRCGMFDARPHCFRLEGNVRPYTVSHVRHTIDLTTSLHHVRQYVHDHRQLLAHSPTTLQQVLSILRECMSGSTYQPIEELQRLVTHVERQRAVQSSHIIPIVVNCEGPLPDPPVLYIEDPCALCCETYDCPTFLKRCGHVFCLRCLELLWDSRHPNKPRCPMCRQKLHGSLLFETGTVTSQQSPPSHSPSRQQSPSHSPPRQDRQDRQQQQGSTQQRGKISWLMHYITVTDPSVKTVLVTDFSSVLPFVERALRNAGWTVFTMLTSQTQDQRTRCINQFNQHPHGAFLLGRRSVIGTGHNLTSATNLISWEPEFEKADQIQCEGRLDRVGQTRNVTIHRLVTTDSVNRV